MTVDFEIDIFLPIKTNIEDEKYIPSSINCLIASKKGFVIQPLSHAVQSDNFFIVLQKSMLIFSITTIINTVKIYYEH
jgi:hypothetical protein